MAGLFSFFQDFADIITDIQPCLIIQGRKRLVKKQKLRLQRKGTYQAALWRIPPDN